MAFAVSPRLPILISLLPCVSIAGIHWVCLHALRSISRPSLPRSSGATIGAGGKSRHLIYHRIEPRFFYRLLAISEACVRVLERIVFSGSSGGFEAFERRLFQGAGANTDAAPPSPPGQPIAVGEFRLSGQGGTYTWMINQSTPQSTSYFIRCIKLH